MTESPSTPDLAAQDDRPAQPSAGNLLRWGLLVVGAIALSVLGIFNLARRSEPLPIIKEVPAFTLTHHDGTTVTREQFAGEPWIADFIFTRCPAICPRMTQQMSHVADALGERSPVKIASFSVDPEHDTPEVLAAYAAKHGAGGGWYFLTGGMEEIHTLSREGFLLGVEVSPSPDIAAGNDPVIHSNRFVLVDHQNRIRGFYDPFDQTDVDRLLRDVRTVLRER